MTKEEKILKSIEYLFGTVGHAKGNYNFESWSNHKAVIRITNDFGGCTEIIKDTTCAGLLRQLETISKYKNEMEKMGK